MIGINVMRFEMKERIYDVGFYNLGEDRWVEVSVCNDNIVAAIWNGKIQTVRRFHGPAAYLIATKARELGEPVSCLPTWCRPLLLSPKHLNTSCLKG